MQVVYLNLGAKSYRIHIGSGLLQDGVLIRRLVPGEQVLVVTNESIAPLYLSTLRDALPDHQLDSVCLPDGEAYKSMQSLNQIFDVLLEKQHYRSTTIIALGGGVVGDIAGFAAASYQRGVACIQIPTTLLAQVDSSVGGKTAVNHPLGKNMIGAFHQPKGVVIDIQTLNTLSVREFAAGLAEMIKHGALADSDYFAWLEENVVGLLQRDQDTLIHAIKRSCEIKSKIVAQDEKETGVRALLNLGHTFGHAIENGLGYGAWLHGEAVAAGMVMAADLSMRLGLCPHGQGLRLKNLLTKVGLPIQPPKIMKDKFMSLMRQDKKVTDQGLRFVVLERLGQAKLVDNIDPHALATTLNAGGKLLDT